MTTFELIEDFVKRAEKAEKKGTLTLVNVTTKYVNKKNADDVFLSLDEAFEKGVNLAHYEKKVEKTGLKYDIESFVEKKDVEMMRKFVELYDKINGTISSSASVDVNVHNIAQKLNIAYKKFDEKFEAGVKEDIVKAYQKVEELFTAKGENSRVSKRLIEIREKVKDMI